MGLISRVSSRTYREVNRIPFIKWLTTVTSQKPKSSQNLSHGTDNRPSVLTPTITEKPKVKSTQTNTLLSIKKMVHTTLTTEVLMLLIVIHLSDCFGAPKYEHSRGRRLSSKNGQSRYD